MNYPLMILVGKAGVGKDTVASFLAKKGGICIAQADPLKRYAYQVLRMNEHQLWGPSEARNAPDPRSRDLIHRDSDNSLRRRWLVNVGLTSEDGFASREAFRFLEEWEEEFLWARKDLDKPLTPRHVLQTLGTEFGRRLRPSIWVDNAGDTAAKLLETQKDYSRMNGVTETRRRNEFVVITDGRFMNEVLAVKKMGGKAFKIVGSEAELPGLGSKHASETEQDGIPDSWFDAVLTNDKSMGLEAAEILADAITPRPPPGIQPRIFTLPKAGEK